MAGDNKSTPPGTSSTQLKDADEMGGK